jgi:hypothetical protein
MSRHVDTCHTSDFRASHTLGCSPSEVSEEEQNIKT